MLRTKKKREMSDIKSITAKMKNSKKLQNKVENISQKAKTQRNETQERKDK